MCVLCGYMNEGVIIGVGSGSVEVGRGRGR